MVFFFFTILSWFSRQPVGDQLHQVAKRSPRGRRVGNQSPISRRPAAKPSCDSSAIVMKFGRGEVAERLQCTSMSDRGFTAAAPYMTFRFAYHFSGKKFVPPSPLFSAELRHCDQFKDQQSRKILFLFDRRVYTDLVFRTPGWFYGS